MALLSQRWLKMLYRVRRPRISAEGQKSNRNEESYNSPWVIGMTSKEEQPQGRHYQKASVFVFLQDTWRNLNLLCSSLGTASETSCCEHECMKTALCSLRGVILALRSISLGKDVVVSPPLVSSVLPLIKLCALFTPFSAHQTKGLLDHFYSFLDNLHFINEYVKTQPSLACSRSLLRDKKK